MADELQTIDALLPLLSHRPLGLFSDIDGTLSPIVADPDAARITPRCRELLEQLIEEGVAVALITGRALEMARVVAGLNGAAYATNCGLALWINGRAEEPADVRTYRFRAREVLLETAGFDALGIMVEDKGPILAFHYRRATNQKEARETILKVLSASPAARAFRQREGRKVIELYPPLGIDKGTAATELVDRLGVASILCLGDDQTDIDMFEAVERLGKGGLSVATIAVKNDEAPAEVLESADYFVRDVVGVEWLLGDLLTALRREAT